MAERLPIPPARIGEVATAALVDVRTVRHYRERWPLLRATEAAITRAVLALPADPQMDLPVRAGGGETASIQPVHSEKPNDFNCAPLVMDASKPSRCTPPIRRCRVTIIMPDEPQPAVQP